MNQLVPVQQSNAEVYRASTDAAGLCREIVLQTAMKIGDRQYVKVEGWQAIAIAHGCTGSARDVETIEGGVRAVGEIRRMSDGALIAQAEGFVGVDEPTWYGGTVEKEEWAGPKGARRKTGKMVTTVMPKRPDYAIRAMAQTRAISRACRSAFAHVVVLIDSNLSTTPAEEVPMGGFDDEPMRNVSPEPQVSLAVTAALSAHQSCETMEELEQWLDANEPKFGELFNKAEMSAVQRSYNQRYDALKPQADTASFRGAGAGGVAGRKADLPKNDFGLGDDNIPNFN